jgi:pimeloyl-ACP methyl ester carboxylesterase
MKKLLAVAGAVALLLSSSVGYVGWAASGKILNPPRLNHPDDPAKYGLKPQAISISSSVPLKGWLFKHPDDHGRAVLFVHGWGSHTQHMLHDYVRWLAGRYTVLAFDMANHGLSPAGQTTLGPHELADAHAAVNWLKAHGYTKLGVLGTSMGGAVSIDLAAEEPAIGAVVTDGAFARPANVPYAHFERHGYPLPGLLAASTELMIGLRSGTNPEDAAAVTHVARIAPRPLLLIHGAKDHVILPDNAQVLFAAAGQPKQLWIVPGADHMSEMDRCPHALAGPEYERRVETLFDAL